MNVEKIITKKQKLNTEKRGAGDKARTPTKATAKGTSPSDLMQKQRSAANKQRRIERNAQEIAKAKAKRDARRAEHKAKRDAKRNAQIEQRVRAEEKAIAEANQHGARLAALPNAEAMNMVAKWRAHRDAQALKNKQARGQ